MLDPRLELAALVDQVEVLRRQINDTNTRYTTQPDQFGRALAWEQFQEFRKTLRAINVRATDCARWMEETK